MSAPASTTTCPFCDRPLSAGRADCGSCHAPAGWIELVQASDFAGRRLGQWAEEGILFPAQAKTLAEYYRTRREDYTRALRAGQPVPADTGLPPFEVCWSCGDRADMPDPYCETCGAPTDSPAVRSLRFQSLLAHELRQHEEAGRLSLTQAHECLNQTAERVAALRSRLEKERLPTATPVVVAEMVEPRRPRPRRKPATPQRPLMEILLDPKNIQWLLGFGAALLVIGLVMYLATVGLFDNPVFVACLMAAGTVGLLVAGGAVVRLTRFQVAGKAVMLLACLVMPLNLWFYHAQALHPLTLYEELWIAALVCCGLYAAAAWVLREPLFVYVLVAGVTMTGLLLLADLNGPEQFWQITQPAVLLVAIGLIAIHLERAFPPGDEGPFARRRFGMAFFWSGHAVFAVGLLFVLAAQIIGHLFRLSATPFLEVGIRAPSPLVTEPGLQILALLLTLAGTYVYVYSDLVVRRVGVYIYLAVLTLLWTEVQVIDLLHLEITAELALIVMALTALVVNLLQPAVVRTSSGGPKSTAALLSEPLARAGQPIGLFLSTVPVAVGVWLHFLTVIHVRETTWVYVAAMAIAAITCRVGAYLNRHIHPGLSATYFFGTAAATLVGAAGLLTLLGLTAWQQQAPLLMLLPLAYLVAAWLYRGHTPEQPLVNAAHAATAVMLVSSLAAAFRGFVLVRGDTLNLTLAGFFAEAALFYTLAATFRRQWGAVFLGTAMACAAVWQLLTYGHVADVYYTLTFAVVGLLLLVGYRFAVLERFQFGRLASAAFACGNALLTLGLAAGALQTLSHLAAGHRDLKADLIGMLLTLLFVSLAAVGLVRHQGWRRWYVVTSIAQCVLAVLVMAAFGTLTLGEKLEVAGVVIGLGLLAAGHVGWFREQDRHNDLVSLSLFLGSVLVALPLAIAVLTYRARDVFHWPDEVGMLAGGILLLATGFMFQLRSTTIAGAIMLAVYLLTLLVYLPWSQVSTAALLLMTGGGVIFGAGLILSVYRERLLTLPDRIKRREGVFRVLGWR